MKTSSPVTKTMVDALRRKKILTLEEICQITDRSSMTVWRHLKPLGYFTSFNYNGRYYTLAETPCFDANGLWFCRRVGFSSFGTLYRTIVALVNNSRMGMTPGEISTILEVRVQNQLYYLSGKGEIDRFRWGRGYLYLSGDEQVRREQLGRREESKKAGIPPGTRQAPLRESEVIAILAELVRAPQSSARRIALILSARGLEISREKVLAVIDQYDLGKKRGSRRWRR